MVLKYRNKSEYIHRFVSMVSMVYKLNGRESEIAAKFVEMYLHLRNTMSKLDEEGEEIPEDVITSTAYAVVRSAESIKKLRAQLNMSTPVFRNYVSAMKAKGFFTVGGIINKDFLPDGNESVIQIMYDEFV